jgi:hypothetical protein
VSCVNYMSCMLYGVFCIQICIRNKKASAAGRGVKDVPASVVQYMLIDVIVFLT